MLAKRIIPCLDVNDGRVVKGVHFVDLRDAGDPVEAAIQYNQQGADEIVFLDITASSNQRQTIVDIVRKTADQIFIPLTVGGGIRTVDDFRTILQNGADKVSINSSAIANPQLISDAALRFGSQCVVVAIDARLNPHTQKWEVFSHGGRQNTGLDAVQWAVHAQELGAGEILLTSMDRDGTGKGYDISLTNAISSILHIPVIASGGAGELGHLVEVLEKGRADAVLAASIFHYGTYTIPQAKQYLMDHGIPVRR